MGALRARGFAVIDFLTMAKNRPRKVVRRVRYQGLDLAIEFPRGGKRPFTGDDGKTHYKTMYADYGEVEGTEGLDGDPVDVYVGPDKRAPHVFVVTQMKKGDWQKIDEEKCILGVKTAKEARALYLAHYDDPRFCGAIKEMPMTEFMERLATRGVAGRKIASQQVDWAARYERLMARRDPDFIERSGRVGEKIASTAARIAELNYLRLSEGDDVFHGEAHGVKVAVAERIDPRWDDDMPIEVKRTLARKAPEILDDRKHNSIGETPLTLMEQEGLGIPAGKQKDDPNDSKLRKAAAMLRVSEFVKEAKKKEKMPDRSGVPVLGTGVGMFGGALGGALLGERLSRHQFYDTRNAATQGAAILGALGGGYLGHRGGQAYQDKLEADDRKARLMKRAADSARVSRLSDRIDDVGIGLLAAPYAAKGIANSLEHRGGRLGAIGGVARRAADTMHKHENKMELAGLAMVAPGVTHRMARGVDRVAPERPLRKAASAADAAKSVVRGAARVGAGATLAAGAGLGAGVVGAKKVLSHHPHEAISTPGYIPPRLF